MGTRRRWEPVVLVVLLGLAGCAAVDSFSSRATTYNQQAETIKESQLMLNVMRSAYREPLQFSDFTQVTGQATVSGTARLHAALQRDPAHFRPRRYGRSGGYGLRHPGLHGRQSRHAGILPGHPLADSDHQHRLLSGARIPGGAAAHAGDQPGRYRGWEPLSACVLQRLRGRPFFGLRISGRGVCRSRPPLRGGEDPDQCRTADRGQRHRQPARAWTAGGGCRAQALHAGDRPRSHAERARRPRPPRRERVFPPAADDPAEPVLHRHKRAERESRRRRARRLPSSACWRRATRSRDFRRRRRTPRWMRPPRAAGPRLMCG